MQFIEDPFTTYPSVKTEGIPVAACISTQIPGLGQYDNIPRLIQSKIYDENSVYPVKKGLLTAANILKKIYQRGFPTRLSPWIETAILTERLSGCKIKLEKSHSFKIFVESKSKRIKLNHEHSIHIPDEFSRRVDEYFDSIAEQDFYYHVLPVIFGKNYWKHTYLQVPLSSLTKNYKTNEFLDFFICTPEGDQYVIEIDGPEHNTPKQKASDQRRDSQLQRNGIRTIRIDLMKFGSIPEQIKFLSSLISRRATHKKNDLNQLHLSATDCLGVQYAILSAISDGAINLSQDECRILLISSLSQKTADLCAREVCHSLRELLKIYSQPEENIPNLKIIQTNELGEIKNADLLIFASASVSSTSVDPLVVFNHYETNTLVVASEFHSYHFKYPKATKDKQKSVDVTRQDSLTFFLQTLFWKCEFRPLQSEGILRALSGNDSIVLLPTGSGKSIVYQLTALLSTGLCVCIAPLVSLVSDQVRVLKSHYITRAYGFCGGGTQKSDEREAALSRFVEGELYFVFLTPERFQQKNFLGLFKIALENFSISQVVIDEAHVISEWGHDFRPAYLRIGQILSQAFGENRPTFLALTATAARNVLRDIQRQLKIGDPSSIISPSSFDRSNLSFRIIRAPVNGALSNLKDVLKKIPDEFGLSSEDFWSLQGEDTNAGLVFVLTVNGKRSIVDVKNEVSSCISNLSGGSQRIVGTYSSKPPKSLAIKNNKWDVEKAKNANSFIHNKTHTLVATSAFGMGIDKPNVRFTVNLGLPSSIESFYQQAGRAGRDGRNSLCYLIFEASDDDVQNLQSDDGWHTSNVQGLDLATQSFFLKNSFPGVQIELDELKPLLNYLENNLGKTLNVIQRKSRSFNRPKNAMTTIEKGSFVVQSNNVLYCLATLEKIGIVFDLQISYSGYGDMNIAVRVADEISKKSVSQRIYDNEYLYDPTNAKTMAEKIRNTEGLFTLTKSYEAWLEAKYETILKGRLISLRNIARAARDGLSNKALKKEIEDFLSTNIFSVELDNLVSSGESQPEAFVKLGIGMSKPEWQELGLQAARLLESAPNNPGLLLLRALSVINEGPKSFQAASEELNRAMDSLITVSGDSKSKVKDEIWTAISSMETWEAIQFIVSDIGQLTNKEKEYYLSKMPSYKGADTAEIGYLMVELDNLNDYLDIARQITTN